MIEQGVDSIVALPSKIPDLWNAAFDGGAAQGRTRRSAWSARPGSAVR